MKELTPIECHEWSGETSDMHFRGYVLDEAGTFFFQHSHDYSHPTLIATGGLRIWIEDEMIGDFMAPDVIEIAARKKHKFQALEPQTRFFCIHDLNGADYEIFETNKGESK